MLYDISVIDRNNVLHSEMWVKTPTDYLDTTLRFSKVENSYSCRDSIYNRSYDRYKELFLTNTDYIR